MTENETPKAHGHCLCKGIRFTMDAPAYLNACHCDDCRRFGGGPFIGPDFADLSFDADPTLQWYRSSDWAERGFCSRCGSSMFYRIIKNPSKIGVTIGALQDLPNGLSIKTEFFIDRKPDCYVFEGERERLTAEQVFALYPEDKA